MTHSLSDHRGDSSQRCPEHKPTFEPAQSSAQPWVATELLLSRNAAVHNVRFVRSQIPAATRVIAVLKANAYGHGLCAFGQLMQSAGVDALAVGTLAEGVALRRSGVDLPILVLLVGIDVDVDAAARHRLQLSVHTRAQAHRIAKVAAASDHMVNVSLKVDCGLGRFGITDDDAGLRTAVEVANLPSLRVTATYTHHPTDHHRLLESAHRFETWTNTLELALGRSLLTHALSSTGISRGVAARFRTDAVRVGALLYGLRPANDRGPSILGGALRPVLTFNSYVLEIRDVPSGKRFGYAGQAAGIRRRMAILPVGFADGLPSTVATAGHVLLRGNRAPIAGSVGMNTVCVDVSGIADIEIGEPVTVLGSCGSNLVSAEDWAAWSDLLNSEALTRLSGTLPRKVVA